MGRIKHYFGLVKFSHTIFALPFALIGFALGVDRVGFEWSVLVKVVVCMVLARSAAMGFNRLIDRKFDAQNPRTAGREIPSGMISPRAATWFVVLCSIGFIVVAGTFNTLTLCLSPVALIIILGYSLTKRFTALCHLVLGLALAIAPSAAYIATTGMLSEIVVLYSIIVLTWVAGFDIIFALQDTDFDRSVSLHSMPARLGIKGGLIVSAVLHIVTAGFVLAVGRILIADLGADETMMRIGVAAFLALLAYQHLILKPSDLSRINMAFGTTNGIASVIYATFVILSVLIGKSL